MMNQDQVTTPPTSSPDMPPLTQAQQMIWRFQHDGSLTLNSYVMRLKLKKKLASDLKDVSLRFSEKTMTLASRTPEASAWMLKNMSAIFKAVADEAGKMLAVDLADTVTNCTPLQGTGRCLYTIPRLIVANSKNSSKWDAWRVDVLTEGQLEEIANLVRCELANELKRWGICDYPSGVVLIDGGRPMPIIQGDGPRGMARLGVRFIAPWQLDGDFFVGKLTPMGFGVIKRGGMVQQASTSTTSINN